MKHIIKIIPIISALFITTFINCHVQTTKSVEMTVNEIVAKYDGQSGISCTKVVKGGGLEVVKMMFNKEFGKEFMKGVTSITIIDYSDAPEETCVTLRKDLDAFLSLLQEFDVSNEKQFSDNEFIRCFAAAIDSDTLSDFVIAMENDESKTILYMAGSIKVE